jgi:hypothetical protein
MLVAMVKHGRPHRAARVSVPNQEQAIISVNGANTVGTLCKLSLTGGSVRVSKLFRRGTLGTITVKTATGKVSAAIEFISTSHEPWVQAFRFIHLDGGDRNRLDTALRQMRQGPDGNHGGLFRPLAQLAQRALGVARKAVS